jgi:hypothetical protein
MVIIVDVLFALIAIYVLLKIFSEYGEMKKNSYLYIENIVIAILIVICFLGARNALVN